jgi:glutamyl-tRNA synthetase
MPEKNTQKSEIVVRIPPSPTGFFHIGTARTALYNYLFAKKNGGKIIMRMEDTDKERSEKRFEESILSGIKKLGMSWDGNVVYQSERTKVYASYIQKLLDEDKAYYCFSTPEELKKLREEAQKNKTAFKYPGTWRNADKNEVQKKLDAGEKSVIRFKLPENTDDIVFNDVVRGEVKINIRELDDFVIAKNINTPLYNFVVVIDDAEMNISHVIRGEDHISNTPKQILVYQALGFEVPTFAHLPLILNQDKSKLSKRKNKVSVDDYLAEGFLPVAINNFLALLGWNTSDEQEFFDMDALIENFSLERVHKGGAVFDIKKLEHINNHYIKQMSSEEFAKVMKTFWENTNSQPSFLDKNEEKLLKSLSLTKDRIRKLSEVSEHLELFYTPVEKMSYSPELYFHKKMKTSAENAPESLNFSLEVIKNFEGEWTEENLKEIFLKKIKEAEYKNGFILYPLRVALSGSEFSPGTLELLEIFGKEDSLKRIKKGLEIVQQ